MKKYQPYCNFPAHAKNIEALSRMLWLMDSDISNHFSLTPIVVFEAFTIESYLNTLGSEHIEIWDELERLPWKKKISILHKIAKKTPDWGNQPLQFASEVFQIRDRLAHGKSERVEGQLYDTEQKAINVLGTTEMEPEWFRRIDKEWIISSKSKLDSLMRYLSNLYNYPPLAYQSGGDGGVIEHDIT